MFICSKIPLYYIIAKNSHKGIKMKKSIITVVGKDQVGIIAKVCTYLAENNINIQDISQTIVDGFFTMMMITDTNEAAKSFSVLSDEQEANVLASMPAHRKDYLARGCTAPICGEILRTPSRNSSSHITWWLYENATPEKYFK